jgi:hypothetical protein
LGEPADVPRVIPNPLAPNAGRLETQWGAVFRIIHGGDLDSGVKESVLAHLLAQRLGRQGTRPAELLVLRCAHENGLSDAPDRSSRR